MDSITVSYIDTHNHPYISSCRARLAEISTYVGMLGYVGQCRVL